MDNTTSNESRFGYMYSVVVPARCGTQPNALLKGPDGTLHRREIVERYA